MNSVDFLVDKTMVTENYSKKNTRYSKTSLNEHTCEKVYTFVLNKIKKKEQKVHFEAVLLQLIGGLLITRKFVVGIEQKRQ